MGGSRDIGGLADLRGRVVLVFGAGGGGDSLGAIHLFLKLKELGAKPVLGSLVWERRPIDPEPGPAPLESLVGGRRLGETLALVRGSEYVVRSGRRFKPQIVRAAEVLGVEALYIDASRGGEGLARALIDAHDIIGVEVAIGLDSGGDILAEGCEDDLWSPLADAMSLYALKRFPGPSLASILGLGTDGELPRSYLLSRLSTVASKGGVVEITGFSRKEAKLLSKVQSLFHSEASKLPIEAFQGFTGVKCIRGGTRRAELDLLQAANIIVDAKLIAELSPLPKLVAGTTSVDEASMKLNERCIYTELDLERDLASGAIGAVEARALGRERLIAGGCVPIPCSQDYYSTLS